MKPAPSEPGEEKSGERNSTTSIDSGIAHEDDSGSECDSSAHSDCISEDGPLGFFSKRKPQSCIRIESISPRSECGYCSSLVGSKYLSVNAYRLTCSDYQDLIDRGWRRSGTTLYLTDHKDSCCAYYTIRTNALDVTLSSSNKKLLRKWRKHGHALSMRQHDQAVKGHDSTMSPNADELVERVAEASKGHVKVCLEPSAFSEEKYRLFDKYQCAVHNDLSSTRHDFKDFLCISPLIPQAISADRDSMDGEILPNSQLGSYHQCYYLDGKLVAVGVIDILPRCVSSVYLFYDPDYSWLSVGSYSSLVEISLVRRLHNYVDADIQYYYMGYYVPTCPKMTYKARWHPSYLLDLITMKWIPVERCLERIRDHPVFTTFDPAVDGLGLVRSRIEDKLEFSPALSLQAMRSVPWWSSDDEEKLRNTMEAVKIRVLTSASEQAVDMRIPIPMSVNRTVELNPNLSNIVHGIVAGLGEELARRMVIQI
ncbi:Arginyl-tRNA--protein transferase 1 [Coemansia sp. RSA 1285]|nr:Arginyl-tRNA--protein transferase 1 [Coemansia sp. RSA 1804]KAJ2689596.1 Arginyl-tRNA--protein transferase 1 [Coemansia sp. RSA 1285]